MQKRVKIAAIGIITYSIILGILLLTKVIENTYGGAIMLWGYIGFVVYLRPWEKKKQEEAAEKSEG